MRIPASAVVICVGILSASCVQKSIIPTSFAPTYKSMLDAKEATIVRNCAVASSIRAENGLNGAIVGKRTLEESAAPAQSISIQGDTVGWVRASAQETFGKAMLKTGAADAPSVRIRLTDIQINENVHINSGYDARVNVDAAVVNASGKECWSGQKFGASQDWGDSASNENYSAVVNHALDRAIMSVAADPGFQDALCSASCGVEAPVVTPKSVQSLKQSGKKRKAK